MRQLSDGVSVPVVEKRSNASAATPGRAAAPALHGTRAWRIAVAVAIVLGLAWFTWPVVNATYNEGFESTLVMNAQGILRGHYDTVDLLYRLDNDFFFATRFGISLLLAGLLKAGLSGALAFRIIMSVSLVVLVVANAAILVRRYAVSPLLACVPSLMFPAIFETAWFFNDNELSAALSTAALALFWIRLTLPATAIAALLWGVAIACRTDAVLLAPAFLVLMWFELPSWPQRLRHAAIAVPVAVLTPLLVYGAFGLNLLDVLTLTHRATEAWARPAQWSHVVHPFLKGFAYPGAVATILGVVAIVMQRRWREIMLCLVLPAIIVLAYGKQLIEVRYLLPVTPFFGILMVYGMRLALAGGRTQARLLAVVFGITALTCFVPPFMPPVAALWFLSTDNDMTRPSLGRFWSPLLGNWWNGKLQEGESAIDTALLQAAAAPGPAQGNGVGGSSVVVSTGWTADRYVDMRLRSDGFTAAKLDEPGACNQIAEMFTRGSEHLIHVRPHIPMPLAEREAVTWRELAQPCMTALRVAPTDRVLVVGWTLIMQPPGGLSAPGVEPLSVPTLDLPSWAGRVIGGKSYAYYVARMPAGQVVDVLTEPLDTKEMAAAQQVIANRATLQ